MKPVSILKESLSGQSLGIDMKITTGTLKGNKVTCKDATIEKAFFFNTKNIKQKGENKWV